MGIPLYNRRPNTSPSTQPKKRPRLYLHPPDSGSSSDSHPLHVSYASPEVTNEANDNDESWVLARYNLGGSRDSQRDIDGNGDEERDRIGIRDEERTGDRARESRLTEAQNASNFSSSSPVIERQQPGRFSLGLDLDRTTPNSTNSFTSLRRSRSIHRGDRDRYRILRRSISPGTVLPPEIERDNTSVNSEIIAPQENWSGSDSALDLASGYSFGGVDNTNASASSNSNSRAAALSPLHFNRNNPSHFQTFFERFQGYNPPARNQRLTFHPYSHDSLRNDQRGSTFSLLGGYHGASNSLEAITDGLTPFQQYRQRRLQRDIRRSLEIGGDSEEGAIPTAQSTAPPTDLPLPVRPYIISTTTNTNDDNSQIIQFRRQRPQVHFTNPVVDTDSSPRTFTSRHITPRPRRTPSPAPSSLENPGSSTDPTTTSPEANALSSFTHNRNDSHRRRLTILLRNLTRANRAAEAYEYNHPGEGRNRSTAATAASLRTNDDEVESPDENEDLEHLLTAAQDLPSASTRYSILPGSSFPNSTFSSRVSPPPTSSSSDWTRPDSIPQRPLVSIDRRVVSSNSALIDDDSLPATPPPSASSTSSPSVSYSIARRRLRR